MGVFLDESRTGTVAELSGIISAGRADGCGGAAASDAKAANNRTMFGVIPGTSEDRAAGARPVLGRRQTHVHSRR
jgi:hypothetical protein